MLVVREVTGPTLRQTAWHEAGHAVVAWDQKFTVTLVSIQCTGAGYGRSEHTPAVDCAIPSDRRRENIVALAGWAAEIASGAVTDLCDSDDYSRVVTRLEQHAPPEDFEIELGHAGSEAERIVSANRDRIERLAIELMRRIELVDAADILKVIEGAPPAAA